MRRLLTFLVDAAIIGDRRNTKEYAIGISALDRNPSDYYTAEDPAVRVQVGRLRVKLKEYYQSVASEIEIVIPLGGYMPRFQRMMNRRMDDPKAIIVDEIVSVDQSAVGESFSRGLQEELVHQLFKFLDAHRIIHLRNHDRSFAVSTDRDTSDETQHVLECSTRIESKRVRVYARLLGARNGQIRWSGQFDRPPAEDIALQEELAFLICMALKGYFLHEGEAYQQPNLLRPKVTVHHAAEQLSD
ncbi:MAG: hypothetical protein ING75_13390 [Rhodocyclaceae bacterium]|nr:hypothetical protein [Rhodocyclaceae bacterium]